MNLQTPLIQLPKVGQATAKALHSLGITTIQDLLFNFPTRYLDFRKTIPINEVQAGELITIRGTLKQIQARRSFKSRLNICSAIISDDTGSMEIIWFNQPYLATSLKTGEELLLSGKVERYKTLQLVNPVYERFSEHNIHTGRLVPVYRGAATFPSRTMRNIIDSCLPLAKQVPEIVPTSIQNSEKLISLEGAITNLHFPTDTDSVSVGRFRIAFEDIFPQQVAVKILQTEHAKQKAYAIKPDIELTKTFLKTLPFTITASQKRAVWDIYQDLESPGPMNRLLQGDVGSGKTLVAVLAMLQVAHNKLQSALLAPTEILASQHYETFIKLLGNNYKVALLTRNFASINGQPSFGPDIRKLLASGELDMVIGTHALIQDSIKFKKLGLAVIDEQHRFGVGQRSFLATHGHIKPHLLSMSATPIPRTLALSIYGNLAISTLKQLPSGRLPIITNIVSDENREKAYEFIRKEIAKGRQAFVITPRVEDTAKSDTKSVKAEFKLLSETVFKDYRLGLVYGKMKGAEKDEVMQKFSAGEFDILVATSVIEIGVDIPNASVIIIEGAENFGLAQLHQLRGRVGRAQHQSYCFLFTTNPSQNDNERLKVFSQSNDGFALSELDLKQRGFGDLFGKQQTGFAFRYPEFITLPALEAAGNGAELLLHQDKSLEKHPELKEKVDYYLADHHAE